MTQEQNATACGLSKNFISMLETNRRPLTSKTASRLANVLEVDVEIFFE